MEFTKDILKKAGKLGSDDVAKSFSKLSGVKVNASVSEVKTDSIKDFIKKIKHKKGQSVVVYTQVLTNVKDLVLPYVEKLKNPRLKSKDKTLVEIVETHLNDVISPLLQRFANAKILLTP